jgi:hypothetical protein
MNRFYSILFQQANACSFGVSRCLLEILDDLVEQEDRRILQERPRDSDPPPLAPTNAVRVPFPAS